MLRRLIPCQFGSLNRNFPTIHLALWQLETYISILTNFTQSQHRLSASKLISEHYCLDIKQMYKVKATKALVQAEEWSCGIRVVGKLLFNLNIQSV